MVLWPDQFTFVGQGLLEWGESEDSGSCFGRILDDGIWWLGVFGGLMSFDTFEGGGAFSSWAPLAGYLSFVEGTACAGERDNCKRECFEPLGSVYVTRIMFQDWTGSVLELEQVYWCITGDTPRFRSRNTKHRFLLTVQLFVDIQSSGKWWIFLDETPELVVDCHIRLWCLMVLHVWKG